MQLELFTKALQHNATRLVELGSAYQEARNQHATLHSKLYLAVAKAIEANPDRFAPYLRALNGADKSDAIKSAMQELLIAMGYKSPNAPHPWVNSIFQYFPGPLDDKKKRQEKRVFEANFRLMLRKALLAYHVHYNKNYEMG